MIAAILSCLMRSSLIVRVNEFVGELAVLRGRPSFFLVGRGEVGISSTLMISRSSDLKCWSIESDIGSNLKKKDIKPSIGSDAVST